MYVLYGIVLKEGLELYSEFHNYPLLPPSFSPTHKSELQRRFNYNGKEWEDKHFPRNLKHLSFHSRFPKDLPPKYKKRGEKR